MPWELVASVHYQETGFRRTGSRLVATDVVDSIASQLHTGKAREGLGRAAIQAVSKR